MKLNRLFHKVKSDSCDNCPNGLLSELRQLQIEHQMISKELQSYENQSPDILHHLVNLLLTLEHNGLELERFAHGGYGRFESLLTREGIHKFDSYLRNVNSKDFLIIANEIDCFKHIKLRKAQLREMLDMVEKKLLKIKQELNII